MSAARHKVPTTIIDAVIFIILEVAAFVLLSRSGDLQNIWFNRVSRRTAAVLWSGSEGVRNHFSLQKQNDSLAAQNALLRAELQKYKLEKVSEQERASLSESEDKRFSYIPATVVKMSRNSAHNYIILNKGFNDGIVPQSGIVTDRGIVGIVSAVDKKYSYGITLMNSAFSVGAKVGENGLLSPLRWDGIHSDRAVVSDIPPHYTVSAGDTVRTSGYSLVFPAEIPLGVTTGEFETHDGASLKAEVSLFQDLSMVRYVTITINNDRKRISALEKAGEKGKEASEEE